MQLFTFYVVSKTKILHTFDGSINPLRDKETIDIELQLKDLDTVTKRIDKSKKAAKAGNKDEQKVVEVLTAVIAHLEDVEKCS